MGDLTRSLMNAEIRGMVDYSKYLLDVVKAVEDENPGGLWNASMIVNMLSQGLTYQELSIRRKADR